MSPSVSVEHKHIPKYTESIEKWGELFCLLEFQFIIFLNMNNSPSENIFQAEDREGNISGKIISSCSWHFLQNKIKHQTYFFKTQRQTPTHWRYTCKSEELKEHIILSARQELLASVMSRWRLRRNALYSITLSSNDLFKFPQSVHLVWYWLHCWFPEW